MADKQNSGSARFSETVAKTDDGSIQITFTIPISTIEGEKDHAAEELSRDVIVPGFRKGKAPVSKVVEHLGDQKILEHALSHILPKMFAEAVSKHKLKPNIYPKFEVINSGSSDTLQVRANTCEIAEFDLGNYQDKIKGESRSGGLWVPGKDQNKKEPSSEEKAQMVIKTLLDNIKVTIPKMLIDEEVNGRLSRLLEKIEKLGLTLEAYLSSIGKTVVSIREEYEKQSREAITLDLVLTKIADKEGIKVSDDEMKAAIEAASSDPNFKGGNLPPENKRIIELIMLRRKALDFLTKLI